MTSPPERKAPLPSLDQLAAYQRLVEQLPGWKRVGEILVELGRLSPEQLNEGLKAQRRAIVTRQRSVRLLDVLVEIGLLTPAAAQETLNYQILTFYLPALGQAIKTRDALADLRETYQHSLQMIAAYAEQAKEAQRRADDFTEQVTALKAELALHRR